MSAATDVILLDSDEEDFSSPPKRGRRRPKRKNARATTTTRGAKTRAVRRPAANSRRAQPADNVTVINVGDIDSDEEAPRSRIPLTPVVMKESYGNSMDINGMAKVLGVADCSPCTTLELPTEVERCSETFDTSAKTSSWESTNTITAGSHPRPLVADEASEPSSIADADEAGPSDAVKQTSVPKKTTRRGLAKRDNGLRATASDEPSKMTPHVAAVYSQCVSQGGLRTFLQGQSEQSSGSESKFDQTQDSSGTITTQSESESMSETDKAANKALLLNSKPSSSEALSGFHTIDSDDETVLDVSTELDKTPVLRSPTPPPQLPLLGQGKGPGRKKQLSKKLTNALQALTNVKGTLEKLSTMTPKHRGRGRRNADVVFVAEEEGIVKTDMVVKVRYLSTVHRINMNLDEPMHMLTTRLSQTLGDVEEYNLNLFHQDQALELSDTPRSLGLTVADIVDCHQVKASSGTESGSEDNISLVVQCRHSRTKATIVTHKRRPLSTLINKYAELKNLDPSCLRLTFDGEDVDLKDTPSKLDMEDLDVVDVVEVK